eukprot:COSAG05_NODE_7236_length_839_cov_1.075676_1_plen_75_part_00
MQNRRRNPSQQPANGPDDRPGKDEGLFWSLWYSKGLGPGKTLCDTDEMSYECQLSFIESEIGGISARAKAIIAF